MADLHHLAYGWFTPVAAYIIAVLGALLGLACTARSRAARTRGRRLRWQVLAALCIGGVAIWLMHFMAMLGFDVPASQVRYEPVLTAVSLVASVVLVWAGLAAAGAGPRRIGRLLLGGWLIGSGAVAMHFTGMAAVRVGGDLWFDRRFVGGAVGAALVGSILALLVAAGRRGWMPLAAGAVIFGAAFVGMHYTGMAALRVRLDPETAFVDGLSPLVLIVPITVLTATMLVAMAFSALQAMTEEEFAGATPPPDPNAAPAADTAETAWQLSSANGQQPLTGVIVATVPSGSVITP
jgi:NO-binding membrane sensor protein with MHYT domain